MLKNVDIMIAENFKASVADLLKKMYWLRNLTEVAIEGEPLKVLLNRTHGADEDVHLFMSKCSSSKMIMIKMFLNGTHGADENVHL